MKRAGSVLFFCWLAACSVPPPPVDSAPPIDDASLTDMGTPCFRDVDCDDGVFCNGHDVCMPSAPTADGIGCVHGTPPCTASVCDEEIDDCVRCTTDEDGDGVPAQSCGGTDCDDGDDMRFPGNDEVCDAGHDEDCNGTTYGVLDVDVDGHDSIVCCNDGVCGDDCDDAMASVHTGHAEDCDGIDNDCDLLIDEDCP